jgi:hypothetical protein
MIENSHSTVVGRDAIDAYINAVEQALITANAPRPDRLEVLQDLESQIAEMLAQRPQPLTEEVVQSVIEKLEAPGVFATAYADIDQPQAATASRLPATRRTLRARFTNVRWSTAAVMSCALIPLGCVLLLLSTTANDRGPAEAATILLLLAIAVTPIPLWKSFQQLRTEPAQDHGRQLTMWAAIVYCALVSTLLLAVSCGVTHGNILFPLAAGAFIYFQYVFLRRLWKRMDATLSPMTTTTNPREPSAAATPMRFTSAISTPAI